MSVNICGMEVFTSSEIAELADKPRPAMWEDCPDPTWQRCSVCGNACKKSAVKWVKASEDVNLNYCPHCGANMKER